MVDSSVFIIRYSEISVSAAASDGVSTNGSHALLTGLSPPDSRASSLSVAERMDTLVRQIESAHDSQANAKHLGLNDERNELYRRLSQLLIAGVTAVPSAVVAVFTGGAGAWPAVIHGINMIIKTMDLVAAYLNYLFTHGEQKYLMTGGDAIAGCLYKVSQFLRHLSAKTNNDVNAESGVKDLYWSKAISGVVSLLTAYLPIIVSHYTPNAASEGWKVVNKVFMYLKVAAESAFTLFDVYSGVTAEKKTKEIDTAVEIFNNVSQQLTEVVLDMQRENMIFQHDKSRENDFLEHFFIKIRDCLEVSAAKADVGDEQSSTVTELLLDINRLVEEVDPRITAL